MDEGTRLRIRSALSSWFTVLLILSFVVGTAGAWATYTVHAGSETTSVQRTTTLWSATGSFDHSATVRNSNPLFPVGSTLTNRSTYFRAAAPVLDGAFIVSTDGLEGNASIELAASLVLQSADEETTYWRDSRPLNATTEAAGDGPATVAFSLNTTAIADRLAAIQEGIGTTPGETSIAVVVNVRITGATTDGVPSRLTFADRLPIELNDDTYAVSDPGTTNEAVQRTATEEVPREYGPIRSIGGPIALLIGVIAMGGLGFISGRGRPAITETERARLEFLDDRSEFDQWIVSVRLPSEIDRPAAEAASLGDLVNLAIDSNAPVISDPDERMFSVVTEEYRYTYRPPPPVDSDLLDARLLSSGFGGILSGVFGNDDTEGDESDGTVATSTPEPNRSSQSRPSEPRGTAATASATDSGPDEVPEAGGGNTADGSSDGDREDTDE